MNAASKWAAVRRHLEGVSATVAAEIRGYPAPIPACDAQYDHLLERRAALAATRARLDAAHENGAGTPEDFLASTPLLAED